jgi:N6-L-threonylcarbamoyladenine synthase
VVPEIAARSHVEAILPVIDKALKTAETDWAEIDAISVTYGPGLSGSLLIGVLTARTFAIAKNKQLYGVNHLLAHVHAAFITNASPSLSTNYQLPTTAPQFPILALIVSGGHTILALFKDHLDYRLLGQTADDAVGEAFDKVAKILGLPYPGGPSIAVAASRGDPQAIKLPQAKMENTYDFSFSGLKTAVLRAAQELSGHDYSLPSTKLPALLNEVQKANIAASFQAAAIETLVSKTAAAVKEFQPETVVVAGGVAANQALRQQMSERLEDKVIYPDIKLCTDNGAMIAASGFYLASNKRPPADPYSLGIEPSLSL